MDYYSNGFLIAHKIKIGIESHGDTGLATNEAG